MDFKYTMMTYLILFCPLRNKPPLLRPSLSIGNLGIRILMQPITFFHPLKLEVLRPSSWVILIDVIGSFGLGQKWFLFRKTWLHIFPYSLHFGQITCHSKGPIVPSNSWWFLEVPMKDNDSPQNQVFPWRVATNYFPTLHTVFNRKIHPHFLFTLYKDCPESTKYVLFLLGMPYSGL